MTGLFLLLVFGIWLVITNWLAKQVAKRFSNQWWRVSIRLLIFVVLLLLPLMDEIVGKKQFEQLCKENASVQIDREKAVGKKVYLLDLSDIKLEETWIPIRVQPWRYVDVSTGETIISYNILHATGGRLIRTLGISEGNAPLTFKGYCAPKEEYSVFKELNIQKINREEILKGSKK